jgi:ABC-type polysaccharide/polyol phosphate export permease
VSPTNAPDTRSRRWVNPLTYGVSALRTVIYGHPLAGEPSQAVSFVVITAFAAAIFVAGAVAVRRK